MKVSTPLVISKSPPSAPARDQSCVAPTSGSMALYISTVPVPFSVKSTKTSPLIVGGSFTSAMVTVTVRLPVKRPSKALSVTSYSGCCSKFGETLNVSTPVLLNSNLPASFPERFDQVTPAPSGSMAVYRRPTTVVVGLFSG